MEKEIDYYQIRLHQMNSVLKVVLASIERKEKSKNTFHWILRITAMTCYGTTIFIPLSTLLFFYFHDEIPLINQFFNKINFENQVELTVSITVLFISIIILLLVGTALLRHDKKILFESYQYSMIKHEIELYDGFIKMSLISIEDFKDSKKSEKYAEEIIHLIKEKLLINSRTQLGLYNTSNENNENDYGVLTTILKDILKTLKEI